MQVLLIAAAEFICFVTVEIKPNLNLQKIRIPLLFHRLILIMSTKIQKFSQFLYRICSLNLLDYIIREYTSPIIPVNGVNAKLIY